MTVSVFGSCETCDQRSSVNLQSGFSSSQSANQPGFYDSEQSERGHCDPVRKK